MSNRRSQAVVTSALAHNIRTAQNQFMGKIQNLRTTIAVPAYWRCPDVGVR